MPLLKQMLGYKYELHTHSPRSQRAPLPAGQINKHSKKEKKRTIIGQWRRPWDYVWGLRKMPVHASRHQGGGASEGPRSLVP